LEQRDLSALQQADQADNEARNYEQAGNEKQAHLDKQTRADKESGNDKEACNLQTQTASLIARSGGRILGIMADLPFGKNIVLRDAEQVANMLVNIRRLGTQWANGGMQSYLHLITQDSEAVPSVPGSDTEMDMKDANMPRDVAVEVDTDGQEAVSFCFISGQDISEALVACGYHLVASAGLFPSPPHCCSIFEARWQSLWR